MGLGATKAEEEQDKGRGLLCFSERILSFCWPFGKSKILFFSIEKLKKKTSESQFLKTFIKTFSAITH